MHKENGRSEDKENESQGDSKKSHLFVRLTTSLCAFFAYLCGKKSDQPPGIDSISGRKTANAEITPLLTF